MRKFVTFLILALFLHLLLFAFNNLSDRNISGGLQQDNYLNYSLALQNKNFPQTLSYQDSRLFPGLPFLILVSTLAIKNPSVAGLMITLTSIVIIFGVSYSFTKNSLYSLWLTLFPPIVYEQLSKISTEAVLIAFLLLSYSLFAKKKYLLSSLLCGFAVLIRPIAVCLYLAMFIFLLLKKPQTLALKTLPPFLIFPLFLVFFNINFWGKSDIFHQLQIYQLVGQGNLSIIQLVSDVARAIDWQQWRILTSGLLYIFFAIFLLYKILSHKKDFLNQADNLFIKLWGLFTIIFIFSFGPTPILEEIRRFFAVFFPLALLANYKYFYSRKPFFFASFLLILTAFI